jgi:hypothetical protein
MDDFQTKAIVSKSLRNVIVLNGNTLIIFYSFVNKSFSIPRRWPKIIASDRYAHSWAVGLVRQCGFCETSELFATCIQ